MEWFQSLSHLPYPPVVLGELVAVGALVGMLGTLVGVGGGFVVVPLLILGFGIQPALATGTSLVMVTVNALTGTAAYARQQRLDWRGGLLLTAVSYPGSLLGAWVGTRLPGDEFDFLFGVLILGLAAWMVREVSQEKPRGPSAAEAAAAREPSGQGPAGWTRLRFRTRAMDERGEVREFSFPILPAAALCFVIGFLGGMLGIGGGPFLVPTMIYVLRYPVHIATATSQFVIALTSAAAAAVHLAAGEVLIRRALALSVGALIGAPLGAYLSRRLRSEQLVLGLAAVLFAVGLRLAWAGLSHFHLPSLHLHFN